MGSEMCIRDSSSQSEAGARCDFGFYSAAATFKFYDTGFRCCFNTNPDP